jgi:transposase-like protein
MRTPAPVITTALNLFYDGTSLSAIKNHIIKKYGRIVDVSTIYRWILKYTGKAVALTEDLKANASLVWVVYETVTDVTGRDYWIWDIFCKKTRFLLASHISHSRTPREGEITINSAFDRAGSKPDLIMLDCLLSYPKQVEKAFKAEDMNVLVENISSDIDVNHMEEFTNALSHRTRVLRGSRSLKSTIMIIDGFAAYYNFLTPQPGLNNKTPAETAGIASPFKNWEKLVRYQP